LASSTGLRKSWPIRLEPTTLPFRSTWLPLAWSLKVTWATPVITRGYTRPKPIVSTTMAATDPTMSLRTVASAVG
jgi:hypothetical protein